MGYGDALVARPTLVKSAFHNELGRPYEVDDLIAGAVECSPRGCSLLSVVGGARARFDAADAHVLRTIVPHVRAALDIAERLHAYPADSPRSVERDLSGRFGLTPAEARVAVRVGRGLAPKVAAQELGTSWNTVRFQLRQIYAKTGTSGQSELARLVQRTELGAA